MRMYSSRTGSLAYVTACRPQPRKYFIFFDVILGPYSTVFSIRLVKLGLQMYLYAVTVAKTKTGISFVLQHKRPQPACYTPGCTRAPPQTPADRHRPRRRAPTPGSQRTHTRRPQRTATGIDTNYHSNVYSHSLSPSFISPYSPLLSPHTAERARHDTTCCRTRAQCRRIL